jgi:outer membrane protein
MNNRRTLILSAILLTTSFYLQAQEKKVLTLQEAIDLSLKNSHKLKNSQAKIDEAMAALKESKEKKLPNASVSGSYLRLNSANIDVKNKDNNGGTPANPPPKINQAAYGLLNATLPIYSGGRIQYGIESSKYLEQATRLDAEGQKDEVIQTTIEAFANLFKAKTAVALVQENLLQAQHRATDFGNLEKNGLLARNDLLKAELQSSNVELSLLDAQNNWDLANVNMDLMLGLPTGTELVLDTAGIERKNDTRVLEDFVQAASANRKDAAALELRKKSAEAGVKVAKAELYPSLNLTGGYVALDVPKFITVTNAVNLGVGVSYSLSSLWKTKSKVQQADARVRQLRETEAILDDDIRLQVNKTYLALISNRKKIEVYAKAVTQAEENYRIVKNKFDNSLANTSDLIDADVAQLQARLSYTLARADAFVAYNKLLETAGLLSSDMKK